MSLAERLAVLCVQQASLRKSADDPALREQFESSIGKERNARAEQARYEELARSRAEKEDTTFKGYVRTGLERTLSPVPHTGLEALVRTPAVIGGGILGHRLAKQYEGLDSIAVGKVLSGKGGKGGKGGPGVSLADLIGKAHEGMPSYRSTRANISSAQAVKNLLTELNLHGGKRVSDAVRKYDPVKDLGFVGSRLQAAGDYLHLKTPRLAELMGVKGPAGRKSLEAVRSQIEPIIRLSDFRRILEEGVKTAPKEKGVVEAVKSIMPSPRRVLGSVAGGIAGGAVAGLPFALWDLINKRRGGSAAVRARSRAEAAANRGESAANEREQMLQTLEKRPTAS